MGCFLQGMVLLKGHDPGLHFQARDVPNIAYLETVTETAFQLASEEILILFMCS